MTPLTRMRDICLSLPDTSEADHFGESCSRVGKKIFASCGEKDGTCRIVVQLEPDHARRLLESDARFEPYARQKHCVAINAAEVTDWEAIRTLVLESYRLNGPTMKPTRKPKANEKRRSLPAVDVHFAGKPELRKVYDRLLTPVEKFGPVEQDPKKTSIHLNRKTAFAGVAVRKAHIVLTIKSDRPIDSPRIVKSQQTSAKRFHHEVKLTDVKEVDAELGRWLEAAYDLCE